MELEKNILKKKLRLFKKNSGIFLMKKSTSIRIQIFGALFTVAFIMAIAFSAYACYTNVRSVRQYVDERLTTAVFGVKEIIPEDYHDRLKRGEVSASEYKHLQQRIINYADKTSITYLYALIKDDAGKIRFSLDQQEDLLFECKHPSQDTKIIFDSLKPTTTQALDEDTGFVLRTVMVPFTSAEGNFYVIGADMNRNYLRSHILQAILDFFLIMLIGAFIVVILTLYISRRISAPVIQLSDFAVRLANSNFDSSLRFQPDAKGILPACEISDLATNIESMREKLELHIKNLKFETIARERAESELKIAGQIQQSFLPSNDFKCNGVQIFAAQKSAREAGGDLYDFQKRDVSSGEGLCVSIGDVSGKGMPAAIFMARVMTLIRSATKTALSPVDILRTINEHISRNNDSCMFVTFLAFFCDPKSRLVRFSNAGHNPPILLSANGDVRYLKFSPNTVLGVFDDAEFSEEVHQFESGDTLVFYTDGVTEACSASGEFYGEEKLLDLVRSNASAAPKEIVNGIMRSVLDFECGAEQSDDITALAIKFV